MAGIEDLSEGDTEHLPALVEDGFYHTAEQLLIATEVCHFITGHADNGTLYLWRRIEYARFDREQIFHIVPSLNEDGENTILIVAWL